MKYKLLIKWILVILWMIVIFTFSNMNGDDSEDKSNGLINYGVNCVIDAGNNLGITDYQLSDNEIEELIEKLSYPVRKCAHMFLYFVYSILLILLLKEYNISFKKIFIYALITCFIYSLTDEFHQLFISDRSGQFSDCLIDTFGGLIGCMFYKSIHKFKNRKLKLG